MVVLENDDLESGAFTVTDILVLPPGSEPRQVVVGQFDGEPALDAALTLFGKDKIQIYLSGRGSGDFMLAPPVEFDVPGAHGIATGDFDGDGLLDLAASSLTEGNIRLFMNDGQSQDRFVAASGNPFPCGAGPYHLATAKLDGDNRDDLLVANAFGAADEILSTRTANYADPVASRDGMKLASTARIDGVKQIVLFDFRPVTGMTETILTSSAGDKGGFAWDPVTSPAGSSTRLYYGSGADNATYVIRIPAPQ